MGYVIPPGYSRINVEYDAVSILGSKPSWGIGVAAPPSDDLLDVVEAWVDTVLQPNTTLDVVVTRLTARSDLLVVDRPVNYPGAKTGPFPAPNTSALVTLSSGLTGRQNRGRVYLPFLVSEAQISGGGQIDAAGITAVNTTFGALFADLVDVAANPVILHSAELTPTPVTAWTVQNVAATQRRRMRR